MEVVNGKEKKGSKLKVLVIILSILLIMALGAGSYFAYNFFFNKEANAGNTATTNAQHVITNTTQQGTAQSSFLQQVVSEKTLPLGEFLVNLSDDDGKKNLKIKVSLGYDGTKLDKELSGETEAIKAKKEIITDTVLTVLRSKKSTDINTSKGVDNLKMELIQRINPMLKNGQLNNIYFTEMLVQ